MKKIDLAVCLDDNYLMPTTVLLNSIGHNKCDEEILIHSVSAKELSEDSKNVLRMECQKYGMSIAFYAYNLREKETFKGVEAGRWALDTFLKLYLAEILPLHIKKVLYIDGDVIVRHSLWDIWETDVTDIPVAGACDSAEFTKGLQKSMHYDHSKFGFINAGVLVMNLDYHRQYNIDNAYDKFIVENYSTLMYVDQDVFNNVLVGKIKFIEKKYNVHFASHVKFWENYPKLSFSEKKRLYKDPYIIHYTGVVKPWHLYSGNIFNEEWDMYMMMSCYKKYKKVARLGYDKPIDILKYMLRPLYKLIFR